MIHTITLLFGVTFMYSTPLVFGALGGVISERSGVTNIGIEGMMTVGAFTGAAIGYYSENPWLGLLCAAVSGGILAVFHALASITFRADQTISGVAMNLLGPAFSVFFCRFAFEGATMSLPVPEKLPKIFGNGVKGIAANLNIEVMTLAAFLLMIFLWFFLYKTKWGMRILAVGENPAAADTLGISVYTVRYACVIFSGILAGIGGATVTLGIVAQFSQTAISGQGFIALAAVIFGKWKPQGAYMACLLFGLAQALTVVLGGGGIQIPTEFLAMLPYIITIMVLILFVGKSEAPKFNGIPYKKGMR